MSKSDRKNNPDAVEEFMQSLQTPMPVASITEPGPSGLELPHMEAETMAEIAGRLARNGDSSRIAIGAELVNVFNNAVQVQGKRQYWTAEDFRVFLIALAAIDSIGAKTLGQEVAEVESQLRRNNQ